MGVLVVYLIGAGLGYGIGYGVCLLKADKKLQALKPKRDRKGRFTK